MGAVMIQTDLPAPKLGGGGPYIMGVLNVTPDSFSDGGKWEGAAAPRALAMLEAGADIIDVGGESTRPGAEPVVEGAEIARIVPVIAAIRAATSAPISIDTMKPAVARAAAEVGANLWNDVAALRQPGALEMAQIVEPCPYCCSVRKSFTNGLDTVFLTELRGFLTDPQTRDAFQRSHRNGRQVSSVGQLERAPGGNLMVPGTHGLITFGV